MHEGKAISGELFLQFVWAIPRPAIAHNNSESLSIGLPYTCSVHVVAMS